MDTFIHEDRSIKFSVLRKLPTGCVLLSLVLTKDMSGLDRDAILVMWRDRGDLRQAHFCIHTGEYLGDKIRNQDGKFV